MLELMLGLLVLAVIIAAVLAYVEAIDLFELVAAIVRLAAEVVKLAAGLLFAAGAFLVWLLRRRGQEKRP